MDISIVGSMLQGSKKFFSFEITRLNGAGARQMVWMLFATVAAGGFNYLANVAVGRLLGPADYSVYATMLSLTLILGAVTSIIQTVTTNYVTQLKSSGKEDEISPLLFTLMKKVLIYSFLGLLVIIGLSQPISRYLQLSSSLPVTIMAFTLIPCAVLPVFQGGARGLERYIVYGITQIAMALLRLVLGVAFIHFGWGVIGSVASLPLYFFLALGFGLFGVIDLMKFRRSSFQYHMPGIFRYVLYVSAGMIAYTLITNIDVSIVKSRFLAESAGLYSAIATTGKITLYLPSAVATLLLPKVALKKASGQKTFRILSKSLVLVGGICGAVALVFFLFPNLVVHLLFGDQYMSEASLLGPYGTAMLLYALSNILLSYLLALHKRAFSYFFLFMAVVQSILLSVLKLDLAQVVHVMILCGAAVNLGGAFFILEPKDIFSRLPKILKAA